MFAVVLVKSFIYFLLFHQGCEGKKIKEEKSRFHQGMGMERTNQQGGKVGESGLVWLVELATGEVKAAVCT